MGNTSAIISFLNIAATDALSNINLSSDLNECVGLHVASLEQHATRGFS